MNEKSKPTRQLHALRIDANTVIYVTAEKANETYRQDYLRRLKLAKSQIILGHKCYQID